MKRIIFLLSISFFLFSCQEKKSETTSQPKSDPCNQEVVDANSIQTVTWKDLTDITFEEKYYEDINEWMLFPAFGESVKKIDGNIIEIEGYVVPIEPERYALSANPFASCFFCGNAGPESVIELELTSYEKVFFTDDYLTFQGTFTLNDTNVDKMNYILKCAFDIPE